MSKHSLHSGDTAGLLNHLTTLRDKAHARVGASFPIIVIQEAGLDGFWVHRVLNRNRWSPRHVAQRLLLLLVQAFTPEGPVVIGINDTLERRWGTRNNGDRIGRKTAS